MFTPDERKRLKNFCEVCDGIAACRFIRDFHKQPHHILVGRLPDGRVMDEYPRYDDDDFRALMTHYRKLRLEGEPTNLLAIMKLLKSKGDPNDVAMFKQFKKDIKEEGQSWWGAAVRDQNGDRELLTQVELEELVLYGEVIHANPDQKDKLRRLTGRSGLLKALAFYNYVRFVRVVVWCAQKTAEIIRSRGYFTVAAPPCPG